MENKLVTNPPLLYGRKMKQARAEKYLGDQISFGGLAESVAATVTKRTGKVLQSIFEIRTVIDDCRSHVTGGIITGLEIWEMAIIPYLTNNCDSWVNIPAKTIDALDNLQNLFYRVLLSVPAGCPTPIMYWDCHGLSMKLRVVQKKLLFLHHLATLDDDSLAKQVFNVQNKLALPGLVEECQEYLVKFGISDITKYSKPQWKRLILDKIDSLNKATLLDTMKCKYKKLDHQKFAEENFELQPYLIDLQTNQARNKFRIRSFMTKTVKMNFPSDEGYKRQLWKCQHCPNIDTQSHIQHCPAYEHLREGKNLDNDLDLVKYFQQVIAMREANDDIDG